MLSPERHTRRGRRNVTEANGQRRETGHGRSLELAAILAADVAGYSLTGLNEEGTLKRLRKLRREQICWSGCILPSIAVTPGKKRITSCLISRSQREL
ncbi:MAG TPA: hypothetical protein VF873_09825, partial [Gemmatimonadales bacterium]